MNGNALSQTPMTSLHIKRSDYAKIRATMTDLHSKMMDLLSREDILTCGRHLGLLHKKTLTFNDETEMTILADYENYSYRPRGYNLAELYLRLNRDKLDEFTRALLMRMSKAQFSLFRIESVGRKSVVEATELLLDFRFTLMDRGISASVGPGRILAGHLISFDDFTIQSGGMFPIDWDFLEACPPARRVLAPLTIGENPRDDANARAKLARAVISAAIRMGYTELVNYR